jgi:hypothetical protein
MTPPDWTTLRILLAAIECGSGRRRSRRAEPKGRDLELF